MRGTILPGRKWDVMVDLFFYRDPEEAKDQEEEAAGAPEYAAIADYTAPGQWGGDQWTSDVAAPPPVAGGDWPAAEAPVAGGDGWDQAPVAVEGAAPAAVAAPGWDPAAQPAAQGWE